MITFWRPIASNTIHIMHPKAGRVICGEYIASSTGWVATGDTPEFATCNKCIEGAVDALFRRVE